MEVAYSPGKVEGDHDMCTYLKLHSFNYMNNIFVVFYQVKVQMTENLNLNTVAPQLSQKNKSTNQANKKG